MSLKCLFLIGIFIVLSVEVASGRAAAAVQPVPPHPPGTVCFTPKFWCWAQPTGLPGTPCACPTPYGWVEGFRG
jgi:hypothetical protein